VHRRCQSSALARNLDFAAGRRSVPCGVRRRSRARERADGAGRGRTGGCRRIDRNLDLRQTSRVRNMRNMFAHARRFNGNMSLWGTLDVRYFQSMFFKATSFDRDVFRVDVGNGTDFRNMFERAVSFDGDLFACSQDLHDRSYPAGQRSVAGDLPPDRRFRSCARV